MREPLQPRPSASTVPAASLSQGPPSLQPSHLTCRICPNGLAHRGTQGDLGFWLGGPRGRHPSRCVCGGGLSVPDISNRRVVGSQSWAGAPSRVCLAAYPS